MSVGTFAAAQLLRIVPRVPLSRAVGRLCEMPLSPKLSGLVSQVYARAYGVNLEEAEPCAEGYPSFDAFFTRRLRDGARQVDDAPLVSPADGSLQSKGPIAADAQIVVKQQSYEVAELIGDEAGAKRYQGGQFAVVYLSPRDYHRVHSPADGEIREVRAISGDLYPVNAIGERHISGLFVKNQRVAIAIDSEHHGRVMVVLVGATIVGRISVTALENRAGQPGLATNGGRQAQHVPAGLHRLTPPQRIARGDEIGVFHLGSTAVVLVEPGLGIERELGPVRYGQTLVKS